MTPPLSVCLILSGFCLRNLQKCEFGCVKNFIPYFEKSRPQKIIFDFFIVFQSVMVAKKYFGKDFSS